MATEKYLEIACLSFPMTWTLKRVMKACPHLEATGSDSNDVLHACGIAAHHTGARFSEEG